MGKKIFIFFGLMIVAGVIAAQDITSDITLMDYKRLAQLNDTTKLPARSFLMRSSSQLWDEVFEVTDQKRKNLKFDLLQIGATTQTNSDLPIGSNDGSMYPSVGLQQRVTLGASLRWKWLSLHLQPELVKAENLDPVSFESDPGDPNYWARYYMYVVNKIDNFSRFGTEEINKVSLGQSSLRFNYNGLSLGVSSENLWWGPGIKNSLVMTNNAPGFLHGTFNTQKPLATPFGNIEFQVVYGQLQDAESESPDNARMRGIWADGIASKNNSERDLFGYTFSWNPKWTPNLHIGTAGVNYFYKDALNPQASFLLLDAENKAGSASLGSLFVRYAMPKDHAEVYFEYGRANKLVSPFNIIGDTIPTGYTGGFRKLFIRPGNKAGILFGIEITQLQLPDARLIFNRDAIWGAPRTNSWYTHPYIAQGYSNEAQVMGASVGPGGNSEMVQISWVKGLKKIGFTAERLSHNNDFYIYNYFSGNLGQGQTNKYWVDWNLGLQVQWDFKQFLFSGFYNYTSALNYRWVKLDGGFADPSELSDRSNTQLSCSLSYFFKRRASSLILIK